MKKISQKALIFDCDGVIVDSEPFSCGAWNLVFENKYNIDVGTNYDGILGKRAQDSVLYYLKKYNIPHSNALENQLIALKEEAYYSLARGTLKPMEGVKTCIQLAKELGWKVAVASSGSLEKIQFSLEEVHLWDKFDLIISGEEVENGKPAPDLFTETIKRLGVTPEQSIIIEDSLNGVLAAKSSGAFTVALVGTFTAEQLSTASPDLTIRSFRKLNLRGIDSF